MTKDNKETQHVITTEKVQEIIDKERVGIKLKLHEKLWFDGTFGVRKPGVVFARTPEEVEEYTKSKINIHYFSEHYCKVKLEDGKTNLIPLRPYQKKILDLYKDNRYSILMASRQTGKCNSLITNVLVMGVDGIPVEMTMGELYYQELSKIRPLNIYENIKRFLYKILSKIK